MILLIFNSAIGRFQNEICFQLVAHEIGHVLGMWHPQLKGQGDWRTPWMSAMGISCPTSGFMGQWTNAEEWEKCAKLDLKGMYNFFIRKQGLNWCLSTSVTPTITEGKRTRLKSP